MIHKLLKIKYKPIISKEIIVMYIPIWVGYNILSFLLTFRDEVYIKNNIAKITNKHPENKSFIAGYFFGSFILSVIISAVLTLAFIIASEVMFLPASTASLPATARVAPIALLVNSPNP